MKRHDNEVPRAVLGWKNAYEEHDCRDWTDLNIDHIEENRMASP